jgi:lipopolysaccharide export system permease protein
MIAMLILIEGNFLFLLLKAAQDQDFPLLQIVLFLAFRLPFSIVLAIPMSYLFACCLTVARLTSEGETIAMQAVGVSPWRVLAPYLVSGLLCSLVALGINETLVPWSSRISNESAQQVLLQQSQLAPKANMLLRGSKGFIFYSRGVDVGKGTMRDTVVLRSLGSGYPDIWLADEASFDNDRVYMTDVKLISIDEDGDVERCGRAETQMMDLREISSATFSRQNAADEVGFRELYERIKELRASGQTPNRQLYELHAKLSVPFASLVFVTLGAPLSLRFGRRGGFAGTVIALTMIFGYYLMMSWGKVLGLAERMDPFWAAWGQNVLFLGLGIIFLWRAK